MKLLTVLFLFLLGSILSHSQISLSYAAMGLDLWFQKMIPSLLPFMILSGVMVRMKLTDKAAMVVYPVLKPLYKVRKNVCYAMLMGFLCGFPMGARVVDDLYMRRMITRREAEYLLTFCNNIGPVYFCSFVLPLLGRERTIPYLFGMYGVPLLYGLLLRHTAFKDLPAPCKDLSDPCRQEGMAGRRCFGRRARGGSSADEEIPESAAAPLVCCEEKEGRISWAERLLEATDSAIHASVQSMLTLGGYMVLFNLLNLIPHMLLGHPHALLSPLLEITGGLKLLGDSRPLYSLLALSFGGLSCMAQTYSCIGDSDLSIIRYVFHKIILTLLNALFYLCWFLFRPASFLR